MKNKGLFEEKLLGGVCMEQKGKERSCRKKTMQFFCTVCVAVFFCLFAPQASAATQLQEQYSTDLAYSEDGWWDRGVQYGRLLLTEHSTNGANTVLLATHCELNAGLEDYKPRYPIYRSEDGGKTWEIVTYVTDALTGLQSEWNPFLFELKQPCGKYPAGTVILAACSIDAQHKSQSHIRLYFSLDGGYTFDQGVSVASGGGLENGVWEPFLMQLADGRLVCFYSDDSDSAHSQKIVYKTSSDAEHWGDAVDVVTSANAAERPGMPVVTQLGDGSFFMVYEVVDKEGTDGNPVCFRRSADGLDWGDASFIGEELVSKNEKKALGSAPYCGWTPVGGECGTLIVSGTFMRKGESETGTDFFVSYDNGNTWLTLPHIIPYEVADHVGYSNSFIFSADGKTMYAINNPQNPQNPEKSKMVVAVASLQEKENTDGKYMLPLALTVVTGIGIAVFAVCIKKKNTSSRNDV